MQFTRYFLMNIVEEWRDKLKIGANESSIVCNKMHINAHF